MNEEEQKELQRLREIEKLYNELISRKRPRKEGVVFYESLITYFTDDYKCRSGDWSSSSVEKFNTYKEALLSVLSDIRDLIDEVDSEEEGGKEEEEEEEGGEEEETDKDLEEHIKAYEKDLRGEFIPRIMEIQISEIQLMDGKSKSQILFTL